MNTRRNVVAVVALCSLFMTAWLLPEAAASEKAREPVRPLAEMAIGESRIDWQPAGDTGRLILTIAGPKALWLSKEFEAGQSASLSLFDENGQQLPDGVYTYELRASGLVQSGHFSIQGGSFVTAPAKPPLRNVTANLTDDDLIIEGFACIGESCTSGDDDFPVLRLKGQNPNIFFEDVETLPSLVSSSSNDWAIRINASDVAKFSIFDVDGGLTPFTILGGAPDDSLYIRDNGYVGLGTSTPGAKLHLFATATSDVFGSAGPDPVSGPAFNFGYGGASYGRGAGFLNVRPDALATAPNPSLRFGTANVERMIITNTGSVGLGISTPATQLHVRGTDAGSFNKILVENAGTTNFRELLEIRNKGGATFVLEDTTVPERWGFGTVGATLVTDNQANGGFEVVLGPTGNMTISGTLTQGSDRATKEAIMPVQPEEVLEKLVSLPISTWSRKDEDPKVRHLGPMAQDFSAIFGLGEDDRHIAPLDMAGVSMASIQALHGKVAREMAEKDAEIATLRQRLADLEELVSKLTK